MKKSKKNYKNKKEKGKYQQQQKTLVRKDGTKKQLL